MSAYTPAALLEVVGARVGIVTCLTCGAAIMLDPRDRESAIDLHSAWHKKEDSKWHSHSAYLK